MIAVADASWRYAASSEPTLEHIDLAVEPGEAVVLCGASGSGKSTLLRMMNGLIPHLHEGSLSGGVTVAGLDVAASPLEEIGRRTGTVLQHPRRQFFTATAVEETAFAMENFGTAPQRIRARVDAVMRRLGIHNLADRTLAHLSGGMQQRVAVAAALAHEPGLLLLDEPSSNLSADAVENLTGVLRELRRLGITIVLSEHRLHYLAPVVDRFVLLERGRIAREWSAEQILALSDADLAAHGLRDIRAPATTTLPAVVAHGASIAAGGPDDGAGIPPAPPELRPACGGKETGSGLRLADVRCVLRGRTVLSIDDAFFPAGRVTAICGPNGAGKTTLARTIAGLQRHSGSICLDGAELSRRERLRCTAIVMQDVQRQLFTDSARAEIRLSASQAGSGAGALDDAEADRLLDEFDLLPHAEQHPLALSGGQQQRLVIAATRCTRARIVIYDEPSSGVDRRHLESIARAIGDSARGGAVVLLITHDEELLAAAADARLDLHRPRR